MDGTRDDRHDRPYVIAYIGINGRTLHDSARTLDEAKARCANRLQKHRKETCRVYKREEMIYETNTDLAY